MRRSSLLRRVAGVFYLKYPRLLGKIKSILFARSHLNTQIDSASNQEIHAFQSYLQKTTQAKSPKIVLQLSTYPFRKARHGGQIRCHAILERYTTEGYLCIPFIIREEENYADDKNSIDEVIFPVTSAYRIYKNRAVPFITDYLSGIFAVEDCKVFEAIQRRVTQKIDFVHVEQPWLFRFAEKLKNALPQARDAKLIYSSQNIEHKLKNEILSVYNIDKDICNQVVADILELELYAASHADFVQAVSLDDKNFLESAVKRKVLLCPNAASEKPLNSIKAQFWREKLPNKFFVFIASAHPPNIIGFFSMLGDFEQLLPRDAKIVVVGSVVRLFDNYKSYLKNKVFDISCLVNVGIVEDDDLTAILSCAHAVLIPITLGGGTNLKTAEALLSGKYVISTKIGFRGYDHYANAPGVYIGETAKEFQENMSLVWQLPEPDFARLRGNDLTWDHALSPLFEEIRL